MSNAGIDENSRPTLTALSNANDGTIVDLWADPVTHRLLVDLAGGSGTVTTVSVVTANGFAGSVANPTTTPAITLTTTVSGILSGNGTAISAASTTGSGAVVLANTPTLITPVLGVATATTINKVTLTAPATGSTLTIIDGKTLTINKTMSFTAADDTGVYTLPTGTKTLVATDVATLSSLSSVGTLTTGTASTGFVIAGVTMTLGSDASYDMYYRGATGVLTRLANGTTGQILTATTSNAPSWGPAPSSGLTVGSTTITSGTTTRILYDNAGVLGEYTLTGTGTVVVMQNTPTLTTPVLGVATATSINGLTITTSTGTLTVTNGKTLSVAKSLTLDGTDSTTMTFPSTSATIARTDAAQTFTGAQTFSNAVIYTSNNITASGNAATVPITARVNTVTNNSAATLTITMTTTSAVDGQLSEVRILDASGVAQTITWVNTEDSSIAAPTTSNGSTTLPLSVIFQFNTNTTKWRCIGKA